MLDFATGYYVVPGVPWTRGKICSVQQRDKDWTLLEILLYVHKTIVEHLKNQVKTTSYFMEYKCVIF